MDKGHLTNQGEKIKKQNSAPISGAEADDLVANEYKKKLYKRSVPIDDSYLRRSRARSPLRSSPRRSSPRTRSGAGPSEIDRLRRIRLLDTGLRRYDAALIFSRASPCPHPAFTGVRFLIFYSGFNNQWSQIPLIHFALNLTCGKRLIRHF